jgi:hypothetical protein
VLPSLSDRLMELYRAHFGTSTEHLLAELKHSRPELRLTWDSLWDVLNGKQTNPSILVLEALAEVFGIDAAHFLDSRYAEEALHPPTIASLLTSLELEPDEIAHIQGAPPTLADKLTLVMEVARDPETRKSYTMAGIAKKLGAIGIQSTPGYMVSLGAGVKKNPSKAIIEGLASIVKIDPAYFISSVFAYPIYIELGWLRQLQKADLQYVAARTLNGGMSGAARLRQILRLLEEENQ